MQSPAAKNLRTPEARAELAAASARARLRVDVAKQSVRLAKEEMKRARKRLKDAKREVRRARKRASAARKAWKQTSRKQPVKPATVRVVKATGGTKKQKVARPDAKPGRVVGRVGKTPAVPDIAPKR
jgi:chromosome segregation ATPase